MQHHKAPNESRGESEGPPPTPAEMLRLHFNRLTLAEFGEAVAEAGQADRYDRLYSLAKHYEGEPLPEAIEALVSFVTEGTDDRVSRNWQFKILHLLSEKWPAVLQPQQTEAMAETLIEDGRGADLHQAIENKTFRFGASQFDRLIDRLSSGYNAHRNKTRLVENYWPELETRHLVAILEEAVEAKREGIPKALEKLQADYRHSLWMWEWSHAFDESRPEVPTEEEKQQHAEYVCSDIHGLMAAIAEKGQKELPGPAVDLLIEEGDRAGVVLRTVALQRGGQLSPAQKEAVKVRLGPAELLAYLVDNQSEETDWIKAEIKDFLRSDPVAFAEIFNEKTVAFLDTEDIGLIVETLVKQRYQDSDIRWRPNLCSALLSVPENLSDKEFYAVFDELHDPDWCRRNADFFTPQRLERFIADGPRPLLLTLVNQGIVEGDEQLASVLEKCGGHPRLANRCGHLFQSRHVDELVLHTFAKPHGVLNFIERHPDQVSIGQFCEIMRRTDGTHLAADLRRRCIEKLSESVDQVVREATPKDLDMLLYDRPSMFDVRHAPELLRKIESRNNFIYLIKRFVKELGPEELDEFVDAIQNRRQALEQRDDRPTRNDISHSWLDEGINIIIRECDEPEEGLIQKLMDDHLRESTAKTLFLHRPGALSPGQVAEIAEKFAHIF